MQVFDRTFLLKKDQSRSIQTDFLHRLAVNNICINLSYIKRHFKHILFLGHGSEYFTEHLATQDAVESYTIVNAGNTILSKSKSTFVKANTENLPFAPAQFDLIISAMDIHWINDVPSHLRQIYHCLKPDGLFLAAFLGGNTLTELRQSFIQIESQSSLGVAARISPFIDIATASDLLSHTGFQIPVADRDIIQATYPDAWALMRDLQAMGQSNMLHQRPKGLSSPRVFEKVATHYQQHFPYTEDRSRIQATFEMLFFSGWHAHASQQKPLKPGCGQINLNEALNALAGTER